MKLQVTHDGERLDLPDVAPGTTVGEMKRRYNISRSLKCVAFGEGYDGTHILDTDRIEEDVRELVFYREVDSKAVEEEEVAFVRACQARLGRQLRHEEE